CVVSLIAIRLDDIRTATPSPDCPIRPCPVSACLRLPAAEISAQTDTLRRIRTNPPTAPPTVDSNSRIPETIANPVNINPARNSDENQSLLTSGGCGAIADAFSKLS